MKNVLACLLVETLRQYLRADGCNDAPVSIPTAEGPRHSLHSLRERHGRQLRATHGPACWSIVGHISVNRWLRGMPLAIPVTGLSFACLQAHAKALQLSRSPNCRSVCRMMYTIVQGSGTRGQPFQEKSPSGIVSSFFMRNRAHSFWMLPIFFQTLA